MADDTEEPIREENGPVVTAPVEAQPAPEINHARALGFSRRGAQVPNGSDAPPLETEPQGAFQGTPVQGPTAPLSAERSQRHAAARAALLDKAKSDWTSRYRDSQPVPANGPVIKERDYRAAETAADSQASEAAAQESFARKTKNATAEEQMRATGQQFYHDAAGNLQPVLEPGSGRPLYHGTPWEEGVHPQTGEPTLTKVDRYGQRQYKPAQLIAPTDTADTQLYYKMPDGTLTAAGDMDKLMKHPDPRIARTALRAVSQRNSAMWKEAIAPMQEEAGKVTALHDAAQQQSVDLQSQIDQVNAKIQALDPNTLSAKEGGVLGFGGHPTAAAINETNKNNALLAQLDDLTKAKEGIDATWKPGGSLWQQRRKATLDLAIFKAKASHDNYLDAAAERRLILKAQGKPEAGDPILTSILQAQKTYGNAITKYGGMAAQQAKPRVSHDELVKTSGLRLNVGEQVPGKPGLFESQPGMPHAIDPVVDPDNPNAPPPPASKLTMVGSSALSPQAPAPATAAQPASPGAAPTPNAGKVDPSLASEPFALAATGVKNIGEVSMKDMAARYGSGQGEVQPNSLVKIRGRIKEIDATLNDPKTQIDGKLRASLQKEQDYLGSLATQRFARLSPDQQDRVTEVTRDPTFWDKVKGVAKSGAEAAAEGGGAVLKGGAVLAQLGDPNGVGAAQLAANPQGFMDDAEKNPVYRMGNFIQEAAKETYAKGQHEDEGMVSQALNEAAKAAGGFAPLMASGPAAPLTIGLQTAGNDMEALYKDQIAKGVKPEAAASFAVKRALVSGGVQAAIFALLPKPLQKAANKYIVDKIAGSALTKFLTNRLAQATEGAALGVASTGAENVAQGKPVTEGLAASAAGLGAMQAVMPRGPHGEAPRAPTDVSPQDAARAELNAKLAQPAEPFKPTGAGQHSAAEAAKVFAPADADVRAANDAAKASETPEADKVPPAKPAEESAQVFKAHEELNRRAAAKEESAQKLVDQIQQSTGKSRGEILATRAGKSIEDWHAELKKEAAYQKNPLVVDPERRASELRAEIKKLDEEWDKHVTKTAQEAEIAAQMDQTKAAAREKFQQMQSDALARHSEIAGRREATENELAAAERLRQSPEGAEKLKGQLEKEAEKADAEARKLKTPDLEGRRDAIEQQLTEAERLRQSPAGAEKLKKDLAAKANGTPPEPEEGGAPAKKEPTPPKAGPDAERYGERVPVVGKEDPVADYARHKEIGRRMVELAKSGKGLENPELQALFKENEEIKNRNSSSPGMPPEPIEAPKAEAAPANKHGEVEGDKLSKEWTQFAPEAKGLGVPRAEMPQVHAIHRGALTQFLKGKGIESKQALVKPTDLKPTQNEYSEAKVEKARKFMGGDRAILVSSDGHVVDGHHQWVAALHDAPDKPMRVIRLDKPIKDLLADVKEFPSAETAKGAAASAGEQQAKPADPQPSAKGAAAAVPTGEGSGKFDKAKQAAKLKAAMVGKVMGIGAHPSGHMDILNHIEQEGGIETKASAKERGRIVGGEHDDQDYPGVAKRLLRKNGMQPDLLAQILHNAGVIPDADINTMNAAIRKAVESRETTREAMKKDRAQQKRSEYLDKFEAAFMQGEQKKPWLRGGKTITVDDLAVGNHFEVNGERFKVKAIDEHGNVTIEDGITRTVPPGTRIFPDKGKVKGAKPKTDFLTDDDLKPEKAPEAPLELKSATLEQQGNEAEAARQAAAENARKEEMAAKVEKPLTGDSSDVGQGTLLSQDADLFSGESQQDKVKREEAAKPEPDRQEKLRQQALREVERQKKETAAKSAEPEPSVAAEPVNLKDLNESKLAALASQLGIDPKGTSGERLRARIETNAHPDDIRDAIANPVKAEAPKSKSQRMIDALQKAKIRKPGELSAAVEPFSVAWDSAIDLAIVGVKAGRALAHMVELAVKRFKAAYPGATPADTAKLEKAIRDAHGQIHGNAEAPAPATPEAKVEQKAAAVVESPKAAATQNKIVKAWNDAREGANLRDTLAATNEAAENQAKQAGHEAYTTIFNELKRSLGKKDVGVASDALGMHVEAGDGGVKKLAEFRQMLAASTKADPKWKARALAAIDYATKNYDKLQKAADLYSAMTDAQAEREQAAGMPTLKRKNYVMHAQDIDNGTWLERVLGDAGAGGMSPTGASSRKNRVFDSHPQSISAGTNPKTLNALDLLRSRITAGETGVNLREWQNSLHNYVDAKTKQPIAMKAERVKRADGTAYYQAPKGYQIEMLGNQPLAIKKEYSGIVSALTDPSWWTKDANRRMVQKLNAGGKSVSLLIDTFHLGRLAIQQSLLKAASVTDFRVPKPSFREGLNVLDRSPDEMRTMARNGEIAPEALPGLLEKKQKMNLLTSAGLNTGHIADAMHQELVRSIPGLGDVNKFIFEKFQRGAMAEAALMELDRQTKSFSDLKPHEVARQVAKDINTRFGNLGKQGWFKSRTAQDTMRMMFLAPQWNEGLIKSEFGGVRQIGQSVIDAATGKRVAMGALGRQMIAGTLGIFAANQIINQMTRGKFTWENPEEEWGAKLSAWIPDKVSGKSSGYFLNPLGVTAEISHLLLTRYERSGNSWQPMVDFLRSRASTVARPVWTFLTGKDGMGMPIKPKDIYKETAKSAAPAPIGASSVGHAIKGAMTGGNTEVFPGQFQKQAMQSFGLKTDTVPSPESRMGALAREFNRTKKIEPAAEFYAGDYSDMVAAARRNNPGDMKQELEALMQKKTPAEIDKHFKSWAGHPFTGQRARETEFVRTLNPEQRATYIRAKKSRMEVGQRALQALHRMPAQLQRTGTD